MNDVLEISNQAGACMILQAMGEFQDRSHLQGGDQFIDKFWSAEVEKRGRSPQQFLSECQGSVDAYYKLKRMADKIGE